MPIANFSYQRDSEGSCIRSGYGIEEKRKDKQEEQSTDEFLNAGWKRSDTRQQGVPLVSSLAQWVHMWNVKRFNFAELLKPDRCTG